MVTGGPQSQISQPLSQADWVKRGENLLLFGASSIGGDVALGKTGFNLMAGEW